MDRSHGSPYDRGRADSYYRRAPCPHWYPEGSLHGERVTDLTPEQRAEYNRGYDENEEENDHKQWD